MLFLFAASEKKINEAIINKERLYGEGVYNKSNPAICSEVPYYERYLDNLTDEDVLFLVDTYQIHGALVLFDGKGGVTVQGPMPIINPKTDDWNKPGYTHKMPIKMYKGKKFIEPKDVLLLNHLTNEYIAKHSNISPNEVPSPKLPK